MNLENWFMGVVEDESDPEELGRVKVRCYGYHTPDRDLLPSEDLPWTQTIYPVTAGPSNKGNGTGPTSLLNSIVFGVFYDGDDTQDAIILGILPGKEESQYDPLTNSGFGAPQALPSGPTPTRAQPTAGTPPFFNARGISTTGQTTYRPPFRAHEEQYPEASPSTSSDVGREIASTVREVSNSDTVQVGDSTRFAARNQKIDPKLEAIINTAAARTGLSVAYFSGGQMPKDEYFSYPANRRGSVTEGGITYLTLDGQRVRTGSTRHDVDTFGNGQAADIWLYKDGRRIRLDRGADNADTILAGKFLEETRALGAEGIGAGNNGYMGGVGAHIDLSGKTTWNLNPAFNSYLAEGDRRNAAGETLPNTIPRAIPFGTEEITIREISQMIIDKGIYGAEDELTQPIDIFTEGGPIIETAKEFHEWAITRGQGNITVHSGSKHKIQVGTILINQSMFGGSSPENQKGLIVINATDFEKWNGPEWGGWISYNLIDTGLAPAGGLTKEEIANPNAGNAEEPTEGQEGGDGKVYIPEWKESDIPEGYRLGGGLFPEENPTRFYGPTPGQD